jgi:hypothetical protein
MKGSTAYDGACACGGLIEVGGAGVQPDPRARELMEAAIEIQEKLSPEELDELERQTMRRTRAHEKDQ